MALNEATPLINKLTSESPLYSKLCAKGERLLAEEVRDGGSVPDLPNELGRDCGLTAAKGLNVLTSRCQKALCDGDWAIGRCDWMIAETVQTLEMQLDHLRDEMIPTLYGPPTFEDGILSSMLE